MISYVYYIFMARKMFCFTCNWIDLLVGDDVFFFSFFSSGRFHVDSMQLKTYLGIHPRRLK